MAHFPPKKTCPDFYIDISMTQPGLDAPFLRDDTEYRRKASIITESREARKWLAIG